MGIAVTVITAMVGTSVFSSLLKQGGCLPLQIIAAALSVLAVVLSALQTFLGYTEVSARHKEAAARYEAIRRRIQILVMKYPEATGQPNEEATKELESISTVLDELAKESPTIPDRDYDAVTKRSTGP
jgi:hypothetical protein